MAADSLHNNLLLLHESLEGTRSLNIEKIKNVVYNIKNLGLEVTDENNADFYCSVIFDKSKGVSCAIRKIIETDELVDAKESLLEFLGLFAQKVAKRIVPYVLDVKELCLSAFVRDKSNKVKAKSLETLFKLLSVTSCDQSSQDLKVGDLIQKLFGALSTPTKLSVTVKKSIYELLGLLCHLFPVDVTGHEQRILNIYLQALKHEMTSRSKAPTDAVIAGCLNGLTSYLYTFNQPASEGSAASKEIFKYARMAVEAGKESGKQTRYAVPLAGLELLSKHADQLDVYLTDNYKSINSVLCYWASHKNTQVKHAATSTLEAFLKKVSESLADRAQKGEKDCGVFKYFITEFHAVMNKPDASDKEIARAIRGYGYFAAPCRIFMRPADVHFMLNQMVQRSQQVFLDDSKDVADKIYTLPSFLEALASIAKEIDVISETYLQSMEQLVVMLIEHFPKFGKAMEFVAMLTIIKVLLALLSHGAILRNFLSRVIYQGLIRTCSHPIVSELTEEVREVNTQPLPKVTSYKDYLNLWMGLLDCEMLKDLNRMRVTVQNRQLVKQMVFEEVVSSIVKIAKKLELSSKKATQDGDISLLDSSLMDLGTSSTLSSDPAEGLHASKPKDFVIFLNLVDFTRDFLVERHFQLFLPWIYNFGKEIIVLSTRYPLVSGFYKLLSYCMKISAQLNYFQELRAETVECSMDIDEDVSKGDLVQKQACFQLFSKFAKEVLVRMKQYKDELLASCLVMVLSLPREIVEVNLSAIVPAVQSAFKLGLSYLPLAQAALRALEYWIDQLKPAALQPYYKDLLPCLDKYLRTPDKGADDLTDSSIAVQSGSTSGRGRKKLPLKTLRSAGKNLQSQDTQLSVVKKRIVKLLGSLGGRYNSALLCKDMEELSKSAIAWDTERHLKFDMPFVDVKPRLFLDPFLPVVTELAVSSSDRQTKVAACELLHSLILYMLGTSVQQPVSDQGSSNERKSIHRLYRKCFPALLKLASDVEQVAKQLFEPLVIQLIHWFTQNRTFESPETMALLDSIMDGLSQPEDSALRDMSARSVNEFLKWSIKQTSKEQQKRSPVNAKSLMKRLYSYSLHPSSFKRFGAALAFNNIYRVLREEDALVDTFIFEILYNFVESLAIAHNDEKSLGTQEAGKQVLKHVEKIMSTKATMLLKGHEVNRRKPKCWSRCNLEEAVSWLLQQCGRAQTACRHTCMELVFKLCTCLPGISSPIEYFKILLEKNKPRFFIDRLELSGAVSHRGGIAKFPVLVCVSDTFTLRSTLHWFDSLLAALDGYTWVFGQHLLTPLQLFTGSSGANIFKSVQYFLSHLALHSIEEASHSFKGNSLTTVFTPLEADLYNRSKCTVVVRLLNFLSVLMAKFPKEFFQVVPPDVWNDSLWFLVCRCTLCPANVGFNLGDVEVVTKLPEECEQILHIFNRYLPAPLQAQFKKCLSEELAPNSACDLLNQLKSYGSDTFDPIHVLHLVSGLECLQKSGYLNSVSTAGSQLGVELLNIVFQGLVRKENDHLVMTSLSPSLQVVFQRLLDLTFLLHIQVSDVLKVLLDKTPVLTTVGHNESHQGVLFLNTFKMAVGSHLVTVMKDFMGELTHYIHSDSVLVSDILHGVLEYLIKDSTARKKFGLEVASTILGSWSSFHLWWTAASSQESKESALSLLKNIFIIDSRVASDPSHPAFSDVFTMYRAMLTDTSTTLTFKVSALVILVFFTKLPETQLSMLKESLNVFIANNLAQKSSDLTPGSPVFMEYTSAVNKLFACLEMSGSPLLLELCISIVCRERDHVLCDSFQGTLTKFVRSLPYDNHLLAADIPYTIFKGEDSFSSEIRRTTLEQVCLPILRLAHVSAVREFFKQHIVELMAALNSKLTKFQESIMQSELVSKICCLELLEVMYSRLSRDDMFNKTSVVNEAFCDGKAETGKELTQAVTKLSNSIKCEDMRGETLLLDLRRQYHCAAYNTLIATITCTQTDAKFYNGFLFKDTPEKGQLLLENIIDPNKEYKFDVMFDSLPTRKKTFTAIRHNLRVKQRDPDDSDDQPLASQYLASQYLADSSLYDDVNPYTFSQTTVSSQHKPHGSSQQQANNTFDESAGGVTGVDFVEMEMDQLNQHPCMSTLVSVIQHMKSAGMFSSDTSSLPTWMQFFHKKMSNMTVPRNVKMFIAKMIINLEEVFTPYAKFWLNPLIHLVVTETDVSEGINYFLVDVIVTLLSWAHVAVPEDRHLSSRLVEFVMKNAHHEKLGILKRNIEMSKTLVECWKDCIDVPTAVIYENLSDGDTKSTRNATGLQLLGLVLANNLPPYRFTTAVDKSTFLKTVALNMNNSYLAVYAASAEVVGMVLHHLSNDITERECLDNYQQFIVSTLSTSDRKLDQLIHCVYKMSLHYPPIADKFQNKLLFNLPKLHGQFRYECLEVIQSRVDSIERVFLELKSKGLLDMLQHRDEDIQLSCLKIVNKMLPKLDVSEVLQLMAPVVSCSHVSSAVCRKVMYDILMWIYDNYRMTTSDEGSKVVSMAKEYLLRGLTDEDLPSRLTVQNFWSHESRLSVVTVDRLLAILDTMYTPATEVQYLSYATNLMLEMTSKSPDYNRPIFEQPLSNCKFESYSVQSSWRQRHATMTPLFAETLVSSSQELDSPQESLAQGMVRQTMDVQFTATQDGGSRAPYNWLTQSSLDTFADYGSLGSESSLMFTMGQSPAKTPAGRRRAKLTGTGFGQLPAGQDTVDSRVAGPSQHSEFHHLRRRFLKDQTSDKHKSVFYRSADQKKRKEQEILREHKAKRESQVTLYRQYRIGDLPDIQIKYSYIIAPLQALAQKDSAVARMLFSSLFSALFVAAREDHSRDVDTIANNVNKSLNTMLDMSMSYYAPFIGCLMDIAYNNSTKLKLDPSQINTAAVTSQQQPLGIALLENMLLQYEWGEQPRKRARTGVTKTPEETVIWIELARLYRSLNDYDVLRGVFASKIGSKDETRQALEFESQGDYNQAELVYLDALKTEWTTEPTDGEVDMWEDCYLQCLDNLTKWEKLDDYLAHNLEGQLSTVWIDTYHQEHYMPFVIRSKLKLMVDGMAGDRAQALLDFIDEAMKTPERRSWLESKYAEELAMVYLWQEDFDRAHHYASTALEAFLQDWASMDGLMTSSRVTKLQGIQRLAELHEFLLFISGQQNSLGRLVNTWLDRMPDSVNDPVSVWDDVVTNRCAFMDVKGSSSDGDMRAMLLHKNLLRLSQAESASLQDNICVALKQLSATHKSRVDDNYYNLKWNQVYASTQQKRALRTSDPQERIKYVLNGLGTMDKCKEKGLLGNNYVMARQHYIISCEAYKILSLHLYDSRDLQCCGDQLGVVMDRAGVGANDALKVVSGLIENGFSYINEAVSMATEEHDSGVSHDTEGLVKSYMTLVTYCDHFLKLKEDNDKDFPISSPSFDTFPFAITMSLLRAMELGSLQARQRFPRLLQLVEYYPKQTMNTFIELTSKIPCWMFISWMSQMVAILDKKESPAVHHILLDIAHAYPQALVYPFKISSEYFKLDSKSKGRDTVDKLQSILSAIPLVDNLIAALEQFSNPELLFWDWFNSMVNTHFKTSKVGGKDLQRDYLQLYNSLMGTEGSGDDLFDSQVVNGKFRKDFAKGFKGEFDKRFGQDGQKLQTMDKTMFHKLCKEMNDSTRGKLRMPQTVKEYSMWMHDFQPTKYEEVLEIPGQYSGFEKPLPEYHVKIAGFDDKVLVLSSIRKPKRITIRGDDEREHMFMVKGGEDLRQDQRIEQLFGLMNDVFSHDPVCHRKNLKIATYQVIPMTPRVGMIEWVSNTKTWREILHGEATREERQDWQLGMSDYKKKVKEHGHYNLLYRDATLTQVTSILRSCESKIAWDLSRRAFLKMTSSPKAFFTVRNHFAVTYSVMCICQYILGIGDRHLSNFMLDTETGGAVGIDFGHAFGSATMALPFPELMPFRMTRQIVNLMMPLKTKGLIDSSMVHALRALRKEPQLLLTVMDVFMKDPSVDWLALASRLKQDSKDMDVTNFYQQQIRSARKKLEGYNPAAIMSEEIKRRLQDKDKQFHMLYINVLTGDESTSSRAQMPAKGLTVEHQVLCLLEQAMDTGVLGRTWEGWEPFV